MEITTLTDATLLDKARSGSEDALEEVCRRYRAMAMRVAYRVGPPQDAEDVVNEAITAVLCLIRRGGGPRINLGGYLATCVRNETARRARHDVRCRPTSDVGVLDGPDTRLDDRIDAAERDAVRAAMSTLSGRQRELLWALEIEGRSPADLAAKSGQSANSISAAAYRARRALRGACRDHGLLPPADTAGASHRDLARA